MKVNINSSFKSRKDLSTWLDGLVMNENIIDIMIHIKSVNKRWPKDIYFSAFGSYLMIEKEG